MKRLFYDLEVSPNLVYTWRTGYKLNISHANIVKERAVICISYKWEHDEEVKTLTWDNGCDKKLLKKFLKVAKRADELVAHNGDRFDIKWFNTRCIKHGLSGTGDWKTIDTLKIAKNKFLFNSNSLEYIGRFLLGEGKHDHGGFDTWVAIMQGCPLALEQMVGYCEQDVRLLERVYHKLAPYTPPKTHVGVLAEATATAMLPVRKWACQHCGSYSVYLSKTRTTGRGTVQRQMLCKSCKRYYTISNLAYTNYLKDGGGRVGQAKGME